MSDQSTARRRVHRRLSRTTALAAVLVAAAAAVGQPSAAESVHASEWALTVLNADQAWQLTKGSGVTVAVVGAGVEATHPDLTGRVVAGRDFGDGASGDGTRDPGSAGGKGTQVAGIIAATSHNYHGDGLYGLAPDAQILPLGVYQAGTPSADATAQAIRYAVDHGAKVIDVTVSFTDASSAVKSAVDYANGQGGIVITGAGDSGATGDQQTYPASFPGVVAVAASDQHGKVLPSSYHGSTVNLAAPGVNILTTARDGTYWTGDGSDYAAPWVAATAALLRAQHPGWNSKQLTHVLMTTADHPNASASRSSDPTGKNANSGPGIVNPVRALAARTAPAAQQEPSATGTAAPGRASSDTPAVVAGVAAAAVLVGLAAVGVFLLGRRRKAAR